MEGYAFQKPMTGRLGSSRSNLNAGPELQNIPTPKTAMGQALAKAFNEARWGVPGEGSHMTADYTEVEKRLLATAVKQERESRLQRAKQQSRRNGAFGAFMIQSQQAHASALADWRRLVAAGWVEVAPGILRDPSTGTEVHDG